jgi:hypothetical protein
MKLNTTNINTIKSAILELFKQQLLPDPKPIHEFFQVTATEFEKMLDERITNIFTEDVCKALNALDIRCGIWTPDTIRVYSACYHIKNPTSRTLDFENLCPEESRLYAQYIDNYRREYSENQQRFNSISNCLDVALTSASSVEGLCKKLPPYSKIIKQACNYMNELIGENTEEETKDE